MAIYIKICKTLKDSKLADKLNNTKKDFDILVNAETELVMKIGYTKDDDETINGRDQIYRTENPNIIHYKLIKGPTRIEETKLHTLFKKDKLKGRGRERFSVTRENFDIILDLNTEEDIMSLVKDVRVISSNSVPLDFKILNFIFNRLSELEKDKVTLHSKYDKLCKELRYTKKDYQMSLICSRLETTEVEIQKYLDNLESNPILYDSIVIEKANEFNELPNTKDKLRLLVEFSELPEVRENEGYLNDFFSLVPGKYKDYFELVGPDRIRANGYKESEVKKEWRQSETNEMISDELLSKIYETFEVKSRYPKDEIKQTLKNIYSNVGYSKTAKASDLDLFFYIKRVYMTSIKKAGFEILAKR